MHCPVCRIQITPIPYEGVRVFNCGQCGGNWLTGGQMERILASREIQMPPAVQDQMSMLAAASNTTKPLLCVQCGVTMKKTPFRFWSDVTLDHCPKCQGIWFDRGELEKVQILWEKYRDNPDSLPNRAARERMAELDGQMRLEVQKARARTEEIKDAASIATSPGYGFGYGYGSGGFIGLLLQLLRRP